MTLIYDKIRGVYLKETPEEKVRQKIIFWLENNGIPETLIGREVVVNINGRHLRADIVVYSKNMQPFFVIECKAPNINITDKVLYQVFDYNKQLSCKYVMVTNGIVSYIFMRGNENFSVVEDPSIIFSDFLNSEKTI